jgi:hypothetical protein
MTGAYRSLAAALCIGGSWLLEAGAARADQAPPASTTPAPTPPAPAQASTPFKGPTFTLNGYLETAYTYSVEQPSNGIINYRGFDNRHNTFTIQNAVIDAAGSIVGLSARVALQVGSTPTSYYSAEPNLPGASGAGASTPDYWRFIQQAYGGYTIASIAKGLTLEGGIFLSPIGPEVMQAKDNWNYSRSNLFFGLPFYHTGARATLQVTDRTAMSFWFVNGWNSVVDNNAGKSLIGTYTYKIPDKLLVQLLYMTGPERPKGAKEGQPNRHLFDAYAQVDITSVVSLLGEVDGGFEKNVFGISAWAAGALYVRVHPVSWLYLAGRGDYFLEHRATEGTPATTADPIFFPAKWVGSGTFTIDGRPHDNVSLRLEYRHDQASDDIYFKGDVSKVAGTAACPHCNAQAQNTITAAGIAWF